MVIFILERNNMSITLAVRSALATALFGIAFTATTAARADVEVGTLSCRSPETAGYIVVSARAFGCIFTPAAGGPVQYYEAIIHRFGAQIGVSSNVVLAWAVFAPTPRVGPGALAGGYGGISAGAAVVVGVGANGLVGGLNSFALQPISVEGQTGLNVVATVTGLELRPVVPSHVRRHHRRQRR
jgi:hypothetical protein